MSAGHTLFTQRLREAQIDAEGIAREMVRRRERADTPAMPSNVGDHISQALAAAGCMRAALWVGIDEQIACEIEAALSRIESEGIHDGDTHAFAKGVLHALQRQDPGGALIPQSIATALTAIAAAQCTNLIAKKGADQ